MYRIRIQLSQPNFTKDPRKGKYDIEAPGSFMNHPWSSTSSLINAAEEEDGHHHELKRSLCKLALSGVEVDTRL
jgi:hypothetical protein